MSLKSFVREFFRWRVLDYIVLVLTAVIAGVVGETVRPHCRTFTWSDPTIGYTYDTKETFPMYAVVLAVVLVALVYVAGELCTRWKRPAGWQSMLLHLNGWVLAHVFGILLAFAIVDTAKLYAGRLRPDFIARLQRSGVTEASAIAMPSEELCTFAREGRLSFPSGHAGTIFAGYVTPCLYLLGLLRTLKGGLLWLVVLCMVPLILPITVAVSRTRDNRHNFSDVLAGAVIGTACACVGVALSFRPNVRGEWTLRDHPDDVVGERDSASLGSGENPMQCVPQLSSSPHCTPQPPILIDTEMSSGERRGRQGTPREALGTPLQLPTQDAEEWTPLKNPSTASVAGLMPAAKRAQFLP